MSKIRFLKSALPPELIQAPRIELRRHTLTDADAMFAHIDADRVRLGRFLPWVDGLKTVDDERDYIRMTRESWDDHHLFDYGIFTHDGTYLGNVGVHSISWQHRRCELGYWIIGQFERQGFASEAVLALESVLFRLGFHRIEIHCSSSNVQSASVPKRCGYRLEGTQRDDRIENGAYTDTFIFGKLENESTM